MSAVTKIKDHTALVERLLKKYPTYRDNDKKLIAHIWMCQLGGIDNIKNLSLHDFLLQWIEGNNIASTESIGRARRKVQEQNEDLRGAGYSVRKNEESDVSNNINN